MGIFIGDNNSKAREIKNAYIGIDGKARKIKQIYVGDENGKARLIWGNSLPMMIATEYQVYMSTNGGNTFEPITTNMASNALCSYFTYDYDNKRYITTYVGLGYYSYDGYTWTRGCNGVSGFDSPLPIHYDEGVYTVAISRAGAYYSTDFVNWNRTGLSSQYSGGIDTRDVVYDPISKNIAELYYDKGYKWVVSTLTGQTLKTFSTEFYDISNMIVANGYFIFAIAHTLYFISTTNPNSYYTCKISDSYISKICYHNGELICATSGDIYKSTDLGKSFTTISNLSGGYVVDLCYGNGYYWIVKNNKTYSSDGYSLYKSSNGSSWSLVQTFNNGSMRSCCLCIPERNGGRY